MPPDFFRGLPDPPSTDPALNLLRLAALAAGDDDGLDDETLGLMHQSVAAGALAGLAPAAAWIELERGLMSKAPSRMFRALQACGALSVLLPELEALFGVPQSADEPAEVDIGEHQLRVVDETARACAAPAVRFAALMFNLGKSDSPREHLPSHYRHLERGRPRVEAVCDRFGLPLAYRDLALLVLAECERVHRAAEMRAGSIAAMLERVDAFERGERFEQLLTVCLCDFRAYPGRATRHYPKAAMLRVARQACLNLDPTDMADDEGPEDAAETLQLARAAAVASALRSERWGGAPDATKG